MNKKTMVLGGMIGVLSLATVGVASASFNGNDTVRDALKDKNYQAFVHATAGKEIAKKITTRAQFDRLVESGQLRDAGNHDGAHAIVKELGMGDRHDRAEKSHAKGDQRGHANVTNGDYAAFQKATEGKKIAEKINSQDKFNKLVEAHKLRKAGNHDGAKALMKGLGLKHRGGHQGGDKK